MTDLKRGDLPPGFMIDHHTKEYGTDTGLALYQWRDTNPRRWWHLREPKPRFAWVRIAVANSTSAHHVHALVQVAQDAARIDSGVEVAD